MRRTLGYKVNILLFLRNRYGMGSTIAVMLIVLCFGFALLISAIFREEKE